MYNRDLTCIHSRWAALEPVNAEVMQERPAEAAAEPILCAVNTVAEDVQVFPVQNDAGEGYMPAQFYEVPA